MTMGSSWGDAGSNRTSNVGTYLEHELRDLDGVTGRAVSSREEIGWATDGIRNVVLMVG